MSNLHDFSPVRPLDENGLPVPAAEARFFIPDTNAPIDMFADSAGTILHPVPLLADGSGVFPSVWNGQLVRAEVRTPQGVLLPGYPMEIAVRSFGGTSAAETVAFTPGPDITATNVQDAIGQAYTLNADVINGLGDLSSLDVVTTAQFAASALRTAAEGVATPLDTEVPTVASMTAHVGASVSDKSNNAPDFTLGPFALAFADARSAAHGLGATPRHVEFWLICTTAFAGLAVGERYGPITANAGSDGVNIGFGSSVTATAVRTITAASQITILNMTTGVRESLAADLAKFQYEALVWR